MSVIDTHMGLSGVLALRAQILERSQTLSKILSVNTGAEAAQPQQGGFTNAMTSALQAVNGLQATADQSAAAWERGETQDIAQVMIARQKAHVAFEATMQARNRLLSAYRDIMNMPV